MEDANPQPEQPLKLVRKSFSAIQKGGIVAVACVVAIIVIVGLLSRKHSNTVLGQTTERAALPVVTTFTLKPTQEQNELVLLPGNTQAFVDAPIYARTNGYLKRWYVDIGGHARQGQLLAEIETPELDRQVEQARADLQTAQENERLAQTTADRWQKLLKDDAVSQQETDQYVSDLQAKKSTLNSTNANLQRLMQLQSFEKVYAPFSGVITARNTDIGALIDAGSGNSPKELFHISDVEHLRIYVSVPEADLASARSGSPVDLTLDEYPGKTYRGTVIRTSDAIDLASRTMRVEIDLNNPKDDVKAGAYVLAHFKPASSSGEHPGQLTVPANALLFRSEGLRVALLQNGRAQLTPISVGRDYGSNLEILSGLKLGDKIILNPSDSLTSGTPVKEADSTGEHIR
jgi:RND family efflux transporter MFP subunit